MPDNPKSWLDKAKEDEQVARLIEDAGAPLSLAAYHLQQSAEKRLKARLIQVGLKPAKTHDLAALANELAIEISDAVWESLRAVSILAWTTRYPGFEIRDATQYQEIFADYQTVVTWLESLQ